MKLNFKQLSLAAAVSAGALAVSGAANAAVAPNGLADTALIPYYTVRDGWVTGFHIINTSPLTQVVKLRLRRAPDSFDALDINVVLSPYDEWTGFINDDNGQVYLNTDDNSCTAPKINGRVAMPAIFAAGGDEGYIEVIGMGQPLAGATDYVTAFAKHTAGVPANCDIVRTNFFRAGNPGTKKGVVDNNTSVMQIPPTLSQTDGCVGGTEPACFLTQEWDSTGNVLKVSYFIRDNESGIEFGNDAVHIADHLSVASMSNQEPGGLSAGDTGGYDYPSLDGASFLQQPGQYNALIRNPATGLGVTAVMNDWSFNAENGVSTDWVVTIPGQYHMIDYGTWLNPTDPDLALDPNGDHRDIPVVLDYTAYDREEDTFRPDPGDLVVSPTPVLPLADITLENEVNVITWGPGPDVLGSGVAYNIPDPGVNQDYGWAVMSVSSNPLKDQQVCIPPSQPFDPRLPWSCTPATGNVPMMGFVAWQRTFQDPDKNYGRIVEHSFSRPAP